MQQDPFRSLVRAEGVRLYRDLPWRRTRDPYVVWLSEVMLQQTQVVRVEACMAAWLERFPSVEALAEAPAADVLASWQGMGYNRRALALHRAAQMVMDEYGGVFPSDTEELLRLPGVGPATAQGVRSFAFDLPGVYLETNVRTVFLHHYFPDMEGVSDHELVPLVAAACPAAGGVSAYEKSGLVLPHAEPEDSLDTPRAWYYALLDYGAWLKKTVPNPSRRSSGYARQSKFEGSHRQKRAFLVRELLDASAEGRVLSLGEAAAALNKAELDAGRVALAEEDVRGLLDELASDGFCSAEADGWRIV